jgi:hypothetical protein
MSRKPPNDFDPNKIVPFPPEGAEQAPEDNPAEWIYPHETSEDAAMRQLVDDIATYDDGLFGILADMASGESTKGELVSKLDAWQKSMGGGKELGPTQPPAPRPWLV